METRTSTPALIEKASKQTIAARDAELLSAQGTAQQGSEALATAEARRVREGEEAAERLQDALRGWEASKQELQLCQESLVQVPSPMPALHP